MSKMILVLFLLGMTACTRQEIAESDAQRLSKRMVYLKDARTNTCFAAWRLGSTHGSFTSVACNPEIDRTAVVFTSHKD